MINFIMVWFGWLFNLVSSLFILIGDIKNGGYKGEKCFFKEGVDFSSEGIF